MHFSLIFKFVFLKEISCLHDTCTAKFKEIVDRKEKIMLVPISNAFLSVCVAEETN